MSFLNGYINTNIQAIALIILLFIPDKADCQRSILDSTFTFRAGTVKTGNALDIITRQTGYNFTYDSRLIDLDRKTGMSFRDLKLGAILDSILRNDSLVYSVIDRYIIISRIVTLPPQQTDSADPGKVDYITGLILDEETLEPMPFATLGLKHNGRGTISNNNGEFGLKISPDLLKDTLLVTYLGYYGREVPVEQMLGNNFTITMKREFISIPEIIIRNQIPQEVISKARNAIPSNYGKTPAYLTGFYREGVLKKDELQTYSEAIIKVFKSAYTLTLLGDQIKVFKSRKIENTDSSDTLAIRLKAGLSTCLELDGAKNIFDFITEESKPDYSYRMTDIVTYDEEAAYVIEFEQKENIDLPLYKGSIYINTSDYGILYAEFELNQAFLYKMKESFISSPSRGFNTRPLSVKYSVSYRKLNNRYFLSHVRGDLLFSAKKKKKLFNTQFKVFFELAITDVNLNNVTRFDREEIAPVHSVFSKTINSYDPLFWGDQNFLRPEENLLKALMNMNVNLQEFSEQDP
jgi:hypothetical protein